MTENVVSFINLERKKCEIGLKYCFDVSSTYMESWDLPSKMAGVSRILAASGSCIDNQEIATSSCQRTTLFFKVTGPELDQLGEQSFDEAYRDAVLPSWGQASWGGWMFPVQMIFKIGMRQTKKKRKKGKNKKHCDPSVWGRKAERLELYKITLVVREMGAEFIQSPQ